ARVDRIAGRDIDRVRAGAAGHLQSADNAVADEVAIVQPVLGENVVLEPVQVLLGEQLPGEEARPAQALEPAAVGAGLAARAGRKQRGLLRGGGSRTAPRQALAIGISHRGLLLTWQLHGEPAFEETAGEAVSGLVGRA